MRFIKTLTASVLAFAVLLTGCAGGDTSWVFASGDTKIPPGLYMIFESVYFSEAVKKITEANQDDADFSLPKQSAILKMTVEDKPVSEWIQSESQDAIREYYAANQKFDALGLSLTEQDILTADGSVQSLLSSNPSFYETNGISENSLKEYYYYMARYDRLFLALYGENGELAVPEGELKAYLTDNFAPIEIILMYKPYSVPEGETKTLEELEADVKAKAESYVERLEAGEAIETLAYEWQKESAGEEYADTITPPEKGDLSMMIMEENRANYGDTLTDAALGAQPGEAKLVDESGMFIVFQRSDVLSADNYAAYKDVALRQMKYDAYGEQLTEWGSAVQMETNAAAVSRYKPERMQLSTTK